MGNELIYKCLGLKIAGYELPKFELKTGDWYNVIIPKGFSKEVKLEDFIKKKNFFLIDKKRNLIDLSRTSSDSEEGLNLTQSKLRVLNEGINQGKKILIFNTIGLDSQGVERLYSTIDQFIGKIAVIELFYQTNVDTKVFSYVKVLDMEGDVFKQGIIQGSPQVRFRLKVTKRQS